MSFQLNKEQHNVCLRLYVSTYISHYISPCKYIVLQNEMLAFKITSKIWNSSHTVIQKQFFLKLCVIQITFQIGVIP